VRTFHRELSMKLSVVGACLVILTMLGVAPAAAQQQADMAAMQQQMAAMQAQQAQSAMGGGGGGGAGPDLTAELQKLGDLKAQGLLTDEEFAAAKARLLG